MNPDILAEKNGFIWIQFGCTSFYSRIHSCSDQNPYFPTTVPSFGAALTRIQRCSATVHGWWLAKVNEVIPYHQISIKITIFLRMKSMQTVSKSQWKFQWKSPPAATSQARCQHAAPLQCETWAAEQGEVPVRDQGKWWLSPTEIRGNSWWLYRENYVFWAYLTICKQQKIGSLRNLGLTRHGFYAFSLGLSYRGTQQQFNGMI